MESFVMEIAGSAFRVEPLFESTRAYCGAYLTGREPEDGIVVSLEDLIREQEMLDIEAAEEGLKRRKFTGPFLERAVIQRRVAQKLIERDTLLLHGSTVAVDGRAYLFTAACGTGKSTHTRLWREVFGERAVMVNDDKPFLKISGNGVLACGSPWTGKHGLGNPVCFPLQGICILRRGTENLIRRIEGKDVLPMLLHQAFIPDGDLRAAELITELSDRIPIWEMGCTKEPGAVLVAYRAMRKPQ